MVKFPRVAISRNVTSRHWKRIRAMRDLRFSQRCTEVCRIAECYAAKSVTGVLTFRRNAFPSSTRPISLNLQAVIHSSVMYQTRRCYILQSSSSIHILSSHSSSPRPIVTLRWKPLPPSSLWTLPKKSVPSMFIIHYLRINNNNNNNNIYLSGFLIAVAVFRKPNAIHLCFSIDLVLNFLLSWLLVLLPSTFFLDVQ